LTANLKAGLANIDIKNYRRRHIREILGILVGILVASLDPIRLVGYILAGSLIRKRVLAVATGVLWMLLGQVFIVFYLYGKVYGDSISAKYSIYAIIGAILVTLLTHWITSKIRASNQPQSPADDEKKE